MKEIIIISKLYLVILLVFFILFLCFLIFLINHPSFLLTLSLTIIHRAHL
ncbi:hypothetical protein PROPEN_03173 [Proteus penneri ATCC 35198]|nr:hypothetical protein PROPEN_03173 [Proteus penneri ATCC 35198]